MNKTLLHVGCGQKNKSRLKGFNNPSWDEIRVDIDHAVNPDIVGSLTDMNQIQDGTAQAIYSSHNLEHLYAHEVLHALKEFHRVLSNDGIVIVTCPDLQSVCEQVAQGKLLEPLYQSPSGPIAALDILFGLRASLEAGNIFMAHKTGFTYSSLSQLMLQSGFKTVVGGRRPKYFDLWLFASKEEITEHDAKEIASAYLP